MAHGNSSSEVCPRHKGRSAYRYMRFGVELQGSRQLAQRSQMNNPAALIIVSAGPR